MGTKEICGNLCSDSNAIKYSFFVLILDNFDYIFSDCNHS